MPTYKSVLQLLKPPALAIGKCSGAFHLLAGTRWRQSRLLILCYHGISLRDEHHWRPLFVTPVFFRRRMELLRCAGYRVLALSEGIEMLKDGSLPPKSVVITFDDGFYDFHQEAFPILQEYGFPATVYQTTYYSDYNLPVFNLILSYVLWRAKGRRLDGSVFELPCRFDLSKQSDQDAAFDLFLNLARTRNYTPAEKDKLVGYLAEEIGVDYAALRSMCMLQLMTAEQLRQIAAAGIDVQLHTHRHRTPVDEQLFLREIRDNREWLASKIGKRATHFCYPSGIYRNDFLPWLKAEGVVSATTCDHGFATRRCEPLLLPRLLDSMNLSESDFEAWLAGVGLPFRRGRPEHLTTS